MGEAIANVLSEDGCGNRIYKFTGSEQYTFGDIAAALTELSSKEVNTEANKPSISEVMRERFNL